MIENDKVNWRNGLIVSAIVCFCSFVIMTANGVKSIETKLLVQPAIVLMTMSPVMVIGAISKLQKRKNEKPIQKL